MATNKPHFRLTTYDKLNPGDLMWSPNWGKGYGYGVIKEIKVISDSSISARFTDDTQSTASPTDKCFASR